LPGPLKDTLAPFFPAAILDRVQIAEVGGGVDLSTLMIQGV